MSSNNKFAGRTQDILAFTNFANKLFTIFIKIKQNKILAVRHYQPTCLKVVKNVTIIITIIQLLKYNGKNK